MPEGRGCFRWEKTKCGAQNEHYSASDPNCHDEKKGYVTLINDCTGQTMTIRGRNSSEETGTMADPCTPVGEIGVLAPYTRYLNHQKNCEKLKTMTNIPSLKSDLQTLKTKTTASKEFGNAVKKTAGNYDPTSIPVQSNANRPNEIDVTTVLGGDYVGLFHTHPNPNLGFIPMFSGADLLYLHLVSFKHNSNGQQKDYNDYFITLTTVHGTYALKINDPIKMAAAMANYTTLENDLFIRYDSRGVNAKPDDLMKDLLEVIKKFNMGISLYQADEVPGTNNQTDLKWKEVLLNPNPNASTPLISQPCN